MKKKKDFMITIYWNITNGAAMCKLHTRSFCGKWTRTKMKMKEKKKSRGMVRLLICLQLTPSVIFPNTLRVPHHLKTHMYCTPSYILVLKLYVEYASFIDI